jgi:hypothetical protein
MFYGLSTRTKRPAYGNDNWLQQFQHEWMNDCHHLKKNHPLDIYIANKLGPEPLNFISWLGIPIARSDFLFAISPEFDKYFLLGKVYDSNGNLMQEFVTFRTLKPKYFLTIRGGQESRLLYCNTCGQLLYTPLPFDEYYILKQSLSESSFYQADFPELIVSEDIYLKLSHWIKNKKNKINVFEIQVRDEPLDGFPIILPSLKSGGGRT